jgi:large subunit ribosomal protein L15
MTLSTHTIKPRGGAKKTSKRVGRGNASGKGTYAARGLKGQRSRSGGKGGTKRRGFKQSLQKVPKSRGFTSMHPKSQTVTLAVLNRVMDEGAEVTPFSLKEKGLIRQTAIPVKIVATGTVEKKMTVHGCLASKRAVELIEKAGGKIVF